jgi:hypothetical protein
MKRNLRSRPPRRIFMTLRSSFSLLHIGRRTSKREAKKVGIHSVSASLTGGGKDEAIYNEGAMILAFLQLFF